jgi:DnaK suppressor protein
MEMNQSQRDRIEGRLRDERERAVEVVRALDESTRSAGDDGDLTNWPLHLADEGTDAMEQEKSLLLLGQEGRRLHEIDEALRRLYRAPEEFGDCTRCNQPIAFERLDILPWVEFCVDCQNRLEEVSAAEPGLADAVDRDTTTS